jgi:hypothetical protein
MPRGILLPPLRTNDSRSPDMLLGEPLEQFLAHWEMKRDGRRRGIVEIRP